MCVRIVQHSTRMEFVTALKVPIVFQEWQGGDTLPQFNIAPGRGIRMFHRLYQGKLQCDPIRWGYRSPRAVERREPIEPCVLIERAVLGLYYRHMWMSGRVLIPINGWYEWTGDNTNRLPWYIRLKNDKPMFLAAVTNYVPEKAQTVERGCAIIADAGAAGLLDPGDLRPVVFTPEHAMRWLEPWLERDEAIYLASKYSRPADDFEWYRVGTAVNKVDVAGKLDWEATKALNKPI